jgi:hypothetical protein
MHSATLVERKIKKACVLVIRLCRETVVSNVGGYCVLSDLVTPLEQLLGGSLSNRPASCTVAVCAVQVSDSGRIRWMTIACGRCLCRGSILEWYLDSFDSAYDVPSLILLLLRNCLHFWHTLQIALFIGDTVSSVLYRMNACRRCCISVLCDKWTLIVEVLRWIAADKNLADRSAFTTTTIISSSSLLLLLLLHFIQTRCLLIQGRSSLRAFLVQRYTCRPALLLHKRLIVLHLRIDRTPVLGRYGNFAIVVRSWF